MRKPPPKAWKLLTAAAAARAKADPVRALIVKRAKATGVTMRSMGEALGHSAGFMSAYVTKGSPAALTEGQASILAKMLGVDPLLLVTPEQRNPAAAHPPVMTAPPSEEVREPEAAAPPPAAPRPATTSAPHLPAPAQATQDHAPQVIPLFRTGERIDPARATRFAVRPSTMTADDNAYAIELPQGCLRGRPGDVIVLASLPTKLQDLVVGLDSDHRVKAFGELVHRGGRTATVSTGLDIVQLDLPADTLLKVTTTIHA